MTKAEADVCFEYHLPVKINPKMAEKYGLTDTSKCYFISELIKAYDSRYKNHMLNAVISGDGRALYHFEIVYLSYLAEYQGFVQSKIKQKKNDYLRTVLKKMLEELKTKKAINQIVNREIDKIKADCKGA